MKVVLLYSRYCSWWIVTAAALSLVETTVYIITIGFAKNGWHKCVEKGGKVRHGMRDVFRSDFLAIANRETWKFSRIE